ncbi:MAG: triphosphoribosyl-dephospho-CoA synthase [Archaeoglobaceae archaeon]|nr:triphosphoribosyl-dephospho-CoA synthase [Archaeoglobaceae archaeon]MDW8128097.1 triphosphoribosyl-dephospho-CoA synthase [Archaeoglobaceae archaeon]
MLKTAEDSAISAVLSLLLEVSANPKSGNVDREHNFEDLRYEHFLISSASAFPFFLKTAKNRRLYILQAVEKSMEFGVKTNVHFGAFLLLFPLVAVWDSKDLAEAGAKALEFLKRTNFRDSINIFKAFQLCKPRVLSAERLSLDDQSTIAKIKKERLNVYEWMKLSPKENLIASELLNGYLISQEGANFILNSEFDANTTIVLLYHKLLSEHLDTLIIAKKGYEVAREVMDLAKKAFESKKLEEFKKLDEKLINEKINPGTIADLVASSIYLAILEGWKVEAKGLRTLEWDK